MPFSPQHVGSCWPWRCQPVRGPQPPSLPLGHQWPGAGRLGAGAGAAVVARAQCVRLEQTVPLARWRGELLLAAVLGGVVGLLRYLGAEPWGLPWIHPSTPGEAVGEPAPAQPAGIAGWRWAIMVLPGCGLRAEQVAAPQFHGHGAGWGAGGAGVAAAATNSRTGALQWLLMLGFVLPVAPHRCTGPSGSGGHGAGVPGCLGAAAGAAPGEWHPR